MCATGSMSRITRARWSTAVLDGAVGETYCIGGRNEKTNLDVVETICALMDELAPNAKIGARKSLITFVADRPGHDLRYAIDAGKIASELGWEPRETFETGLRKTVEWYLANRELVGAHPLAASIAASGWESLRDPGVRRQRPARPGAGAGERRARSAARRARARRGRHRGCGAVRDAIARHQPALVVNAAAYTKVDLAETRGRGGAAGNEIGPAVLGEACAAAGIPLVHISTDYVFDGTKPTRLCGDRSGRAARRLRAQQGGRRARAARRDAAPCDPAHVLGLRRVRPQLPQDHAAARGDARRAAHRRRPARLPDLDARSRRRDPVDRAAADRRRGRLGHLSFRRHRA